MRAGCIGGCSNCSRWTDRGSRRALPCTRKGTVVPFTPVRSGGRTARLVQMILGEHAGELLGHLARAGGAMQPLLLAAGGGGWRSYAGSAGRRVWENRPDRDADGPTPRVRPGAVAEGCSARARRSCVRQLIGLLERPERAWRRATGSSDRAACYCCLFNARICAACNSAALFCWIAGRGS